jgi:sterol 3beta-glucosyltransferase
VRLLLSALGSDGDVEPFMALAQRLLAAGHRPLLATNDRFEARATALGIPFVRVGPSWDEALAQQHFTRLLAEPSPLRQLTMVTQMLAELQLPAIPELLELARQVDVVVCPPVSVASVAAARKVSTPHVSVHFAPLHRADHSTPTGGNLGRFVNRITWSVMGALLRRATDPSLNRIVSATGLTPWHDILLAGAHSSTLDLIAVSPHVLPRDPAWGRSTRTTGYWHVDEPAWQPSAALEALTLREPPVVIGFGSMMGLDARAVTARILSAVKDLDRQVVIQAGWGALGAGPLPANVHALGFVPHAWLFARAACVVHHGGAGTTGAALRAGVPQAIAWHLGDQPFWAHKVHELGVGPKSRRHTHADAHWLRQAIDQMLSDSPMRARAKELGAEIAREDGASNAVRAIEAAFGSPP